MVRPGADGPVSEWHVPMVLGNQVQNTWRGCFEIFLEKLYLRDGAVVPKVLTDNPI